MSLSETALVVQTLVVIAGVAFAMAQLRGARKARDFDSLTEVFREFHSADGYSLRHGVMRDGAVDVSQLTEDRYLACMRVADYWQRVGYICRAGYLDTRHVLEMYAGAIVRAWDSLEPFVEMRREREGLVGYSRDFEGLAQRAARTLRQSGSVKPMGLWARDEAGALVYNNDGVVRDASDADTESGVL